MPKPAQPPEAIPTIQHLGKLDPKAYVRYGTEDAGWTFGSAARYSLSCKPVYDPSTRKVYAQDYTLSITDTIVAEVGQSIDEACNVARDTLTRPGLVLSVGNACIGSFVVGPPFTIPSNYDNRLPLDVPLLNDISNGPKPQGLRFQPIAGIGATSIQWSVTFRLSECFLEPAEGVADGDKLLGIGFEVKHSVDHKGLTTRFISGSAQFAANLNNSRLYNPDKDFRSPIALETLDRIFPPMPGFQRQYGDMRLSKDRTDLSFTITDSELPTTYGFPAGAITVSGSYSFSGAVYAAPYTCTLDASFEIPKSADRKLAYSLFQDMLRQKGVADPANFAALGGARIMNDIRITESLFDNSFQCSISWMLTTSLSTAMANARLFTPFTYTWDNWAAAIPRQRRAAGEAELYWDPQTQVVVDLCADDPLPEIEYSDHANVNGNSGSLQPGVVGDESTTVEPASSWIVHKSTLTVADAGPRAAVFDVCKPSASGGSPDLDAGTIAATSTRQPRMHNPEPSEPGIVQKLNTSSQRVTLRGGALRVKYPPPCPEVLQVGECEVALEHRTYRSYQVGTTASGVPLFGALWSASYLTGEPVGNIPMPPSHVSRSVVTTDHTSLVS